MAARLGEGRETANHLGFKASLGPNAENRAASTPLAAKPTALQEQRNLAPIADTLATQRRPLCLLTQGSVRQDVKQDTCCRAYTGSAGSPWLVKLPRLHRVCDEEAWSGLHRCSGAQLASLQMQLPGASGPVR